MTDQSRTSPHARRLCIHKIAQEKGYDRSRLAKETGFSYNTIKTLWNHPECDPKISTLDQIARVLGVGLDDLVEHTGETSETGGLTGEKHEAKI